MGLLGGASRRGSVLIVSVGVLMVLVVLAVAFARVMTLERDASTQMVWHTQARFAAEAGIEMALTRLPIDHSQVLVDVGSPNWAYGDSVDTPVEMAQRPSYGRDGLGNWQQMTIGARAFGYSGTVSPPPGLKIHPQGAQFALKIVDLQGHFNVNDDNPNLASILDQLGRGIARYTGRPDPVAGRGAQIVAYRNAMPGGKFRVIQDLYGMSFLSQAEIDLLRDHITIYGWQDDVLEPAPQANPAYENWSLNFRRVKRSPVNINTAPAPVLFALFRGLAARCLFPNGSVYALTTSSGIDDTTAQRLTDRIIAKRNLATPEPIVSFYDLATFLDQELTGGYQYFMPIVMANCNPNAKFVKFNSDWSLNVYGLLGPKNAPNSQLPLCDKSDLTYYTTEVCFASAGRIEIESLGRIVSDDQTRIFSTYKIRQVMKFWDAIRHDTQRDFESNLNFLTRCRSYPENMPDQNLVASRSSSLDGQIVLDDRRENMPADITWFTDQDTRMQHYSAMSLRWSAWRWTSGIRDVGMPAAYQNSDLRHNRPGYSAEPPSWQPQNPYERSLLNEILPASYRNTNYKSDLHPDGIWYNHFADSRYRKQDYDSVDGQGSGFGASAFGRAIYYPVSGRAEWWMKPDTRFRARNDAIRGLTLLQTLARDAQVPAQNTVFGVPHCFSSIYRSINFGSWRIEAARATGIAGTVSAGARRPSDWWWPYGDWTYINAGLLPDVTSLLEPMQWNHVRVQWDFYTMPWELYINGTPAFKRNGLFLAPGWQIQRYGVNLTGFMQFGYSSGHAPKPQPPWDLDFRSAATVDQIRMSRTFVSDNTSVPNRYLPTNFTSRWDGRFQFPAGKPVRVLSIRYTGYPGRDTLGRPLRSYTRLQWFAGTASGITPDRDYQLVRSPLRVPAAVVNQQLAVTDVFRYRLLFHDGFQRPFFQTPYVDDVTVFYTIGFEILERMEGV